MFTIDKAVALPSVRHSNGYPFAKLEIGDSFLVPNTDAKKAASVRACASTWGKKNGCKLTVKMVEGGIRVWRVS